MAEETDRLESKRPALVTHEKVVELHGRLDLISQEIKGLSRVVDIVANLERRILTQELNVPAGALIKLTEKVHELELINARTAQSGTTLEKTFTWINTAVLLVLAVLGAYLALKGH